MNMFKGRRAVLATMHGKEAVIAPILEKQLGLTVIVPNNFNSDQFGTFTRDIARTGDQLEAARRKARAAAELTGIDIAIASEGSFSPDPAMPFVPSNLELVILLDTKNNIEIRGHHRSFDTNLSGQYVSSVREALEFAKGVGFPEHGIVIRTSPTSTRSMLTGVVTENELVEHVAKLLRGVFRKKVYLETDMRAHMNPTRMGNIATATEDLAANIASTCPECGTPGFAVIGTKSGLPCKNCHRETESPKAYVKKCQKCSAEKCVERSDKTYEDAGLCTWCNP